MMCSVRLLQAQAGHTLRGMAADEPPPIHHPPDNMGFRVPGSTRHTDAILLLTGHVRFIIGG